MSDEKIEQNDLVFKATIEVYVKPSEEDSEWFRGMEGPEQAQFLTFMARELKVPVADRLEDFTDVTNINVNVQEVPEWPK